MTVTRQFIRRVVVGLLAAVGLEIPDLLANFNRTRIVPLAVAIAIIGLLLLLLNRKKNWGGESSDD